MPPVANKAKGKSQARDQHRQSRSRNTTPISGGTGVSAVIESSAPSNAQAALAQLKMTIEAILDSHGGSGANIPSAGLLNTSLDKVKNQFLPPIKVRGEISDRAMRALALKRKDRMEQERERERADRDAEDRKQKQKKMGKKKERPSGDEDRPLAVGAHGLARQDGVDVHKADTSSSISSPESQPAPPPDSGKMDVADSPLSTGDHQPPPAPAIPHYQTFGSDPSTFDDPTIYHIRDIIEDMTEEEKKEILCVADYPHDDLHDQTCGTPPDRDFSNAKPAQQTAANVFANYVEPYIRPLNEEDVAFLQERVGTSILQCPRSANMLEKGDRKYAFLIPRWGARHYKEVWAEEDGAMAIDGGNEKLPPNEPRGNAEDMNDDIAETEEISTGPLLSRLLSTLRPAANNDTNGDATNGDMEIDHEPNGDATHPPPPATYMPESSQAAWKASPPPNLDYANMDERILQELRHMGFLSADSLPPTYDDHLDDAVAARLRLLQAELRQQCIINGARKARLLELAADRLAQQEYNTIADDLDNQLNAAYLKRNRNIGKGKKNAKRPGGPGGGSHSVANPGLSKPAMGEPIRLLMERKAQWNQQIGPIVGMGQARLPEGTIFDPQTMARLVEKEKEIFDLDLE
ncbi:hypothetical protein M501DRAFT_992382 [Patellaria atrata CBS 101060]|uniref:Transcriptional adapter 3 n=1 Tax=Patellaria atrata CBS 101060 TaxID=1346257 RepID=A0A9P4SB90_9PEZI|nr:hypothetical protein M501DRAFT_992382 [Patellaria atrata CBS 101060]